MSDETLKSRDEYVALAESLINQIIDSGITEEELLTQVNIFKMGLPYVNLLKPCLIGDGIRQIQAVEHNELLNEFEILAKEGAITKFVPASGAATRMFKELLEALRCSDTQVLNAISNIFNNRPALKIFFERLNEFPFYDDLKSVLERDGFDIDKDPHENYGIVLEYLLTEKGLNYSNLPKGLINFHKYKGFSRTPAEEHLAEAACYTLDSKLTARVHFTINEKFEVEFKNIVERHQLQDNKNNYEVSYSFQEKSTNTIAVDENNNAILDRHNRLVFRPGGHGALIKNLNNIQANIVFVKNIDNVQPDDKKQTTYLYKKLLCGLLAKIRKKMFTTLNALEENNIHSEQRKEIISFCQNELNIVFPENFDELDNNEKIEYLYNKLNRPLRVCGMVKNSGEPGGGPFWIKKEDGSVSIQIVESSQVDIDDPIMSTIFQSSTHFNPVDIVCGLKNHKGDPYDLKKFVDNSMAFITVKSADGKQLKAYELPGLWNGSMAEWNTVFVEVPEDTFTPVKTVFDLLRNEHKCKD